MAERYWVLERSASWKLRVVGSGVRQKYSTSSLYATLIKLDAEFLGMIGVSGTDLMIGRVCDMGTSTSVSNGGIEDAFILVDGPVLQEDLLDAPKAAGGKSGDLRRGNSGRHEGNIVR